MRHGFKNFISRFSIKQIVFFSIAFLSFLIFLVLTVWSGSKIKKLDDQQAAVRWDKDGGAAQVSCFFATNVEMDDFTIMSFERQLEQKINEVMTTDEADNTADKRLFIDAYSSLGTITVESEKGKMETEAVGIGGDFFLFHPLHLLSGKYFSGNDLMKDSIILDEEAAWQLFGSTDIEGQSVMIGNVPHYVSGVIERQKGKFAETAGLDKSVVYMSYESLSQYGTGKRISTYEVAAPNPVSKFLYTAVKEKLGVAETDMVVVENSARYSLEGLIPVILDFGSRSMQNTAVEFPYWENIARGWEDICALVLFFQFIFLLIPIIIFIIYLIWKWRHRSFTWVDVKNSFMEKKDKTIQYLKDKNANKKSKKKKSDLLEDDNE